jgi:hypothetical protein
MVYYITLDVFPLQPEPFDCAIATLRASGLFFRGQIVAKVQRGGHRLIPGESAQAITLTDGDIF